MILFFYILTFIKLSLIFPEYHPNQTFKILNYVFLLVAVNFRWIGESFIFLLLFINPIYVIIPGIPQYLLLVQRK